MGTKMAKEKRKIKMRMMMMMIPFLRLYMTGVVQTPPGVSDSDNKYNNESDNDGDFDDNKDVDPNIE